MQKLLFCLTVFFMSAAGAVMGSPVSIDPPVQRNADIITDETIRMILTLRDDNGQLRTSDGKIIEQPLYIRLNAPATVRESIVSSLISEGVRIAGEPAGHHSLHIEWESDNSIAAQVNNRSHRTVRSDVIFTWLDTGLEVQKIWKDSFVRQDWILSTQVDTVRGDWGPASFHRHEPSRRYSIIRRIAEPALITGVVAVTVYLLYNVRR